jgi:hypothetical protein
MLRLPAKALAEYSGSSDQKDVHAERVYSNFLNLTTIEAAEYSFDQVRIYMKSYPTFRRYYWWYP